MPHIIKQTIAAGLAMLATVDAAAVSPRSVSPKQTAPGSSSQSFLINYNFETYPQTIRGQLPVSAIEIGDYDLLNFNTFLVNQTQPPVAGVPCQTAPTCTVVTEANNVLSLLDVGSASALNGPGIVTSKYQYSPISYFTPYVFYYGCVAADANGVASVPVSCNITATGLTSGKTVYTETFTYTATGALLQPMDLGYFNSGWVGLKVDTLQFVVSNNLTTGALIDNLVADVVGPQNAAVLVDF